MGTGPDAPRLIQQSPKGDDADALVRRRVQRTRSGERRILTLAYRMVGERTEAEDTAHKAFLKAYRGLRDFRRAWASPAHHRASSRTKGLGLRMGFFSIGL